MNNSKYKLLALKDFAQGRYNAMRSPPDADYYDDVFDVGNGVIISKKTKKITTDHEMLIMSVVVNEILDYLIAKEEGK